MARAKKKQLFTNRGTASIWDISGSTADEIRAFIFERSKDIDPQADPALTRIQIDQHYDDVDVWLETQREETDAEFEARCEHERREAAKTRSQRKKEREAIEAAERATLARLREKYG